MVSRACVIIVKQKKKKFAFPDIASKKLRFLNSIVDSICILWLQRLILIAIVGLSVRHSATEWLHSATEWLIELLIIFSYYFFFEAIFQKTPGKFLTQTRVTAVDGSKPGFGSLLLRTLIRFIPFEPFSFLERRKTGLHDRWSNTYVADERLVRDKI
ncbi:MAG: RDD family protein [candidate division WOR-3 bacterium]